MALHDASRLHAHHRDAALPAGGRSRTVALVVLCLCALTTGLDITITNVALPFISDQLDAGTSGLQWVVDAYSIVLAGLLVLGGGLADHYGRRKVFLAGYALFGLGCLFAAFSPNIGALVAARALMGVGAAGVIAPALAILAVLYPPEERARAIGLWAVFGAIGLAVGPVAGGLLLARFWWGAVFLVNVPLVAAGVVVGLRVIPESTRPDPQVLDVPGSLLSVLGLAAVLFGIIEGPSRGWLSPLVLGAVVGGVAVLVLFVRRELASEAPVFDVRVLQRPIVAAGAATLFVSYFVFNTMLFVVPQFLQEVEGESVEVVGLLLLPFAVVFGVLSMRAGAASERFGHRKAVSAGLLLCAVGSLGQAVGLDTGVVTTTVATVVIGAGLSLLIAPASTVVMNDLPAAKAGEGSSLNMVSRFVGGSIGVAVVGSVLASVFAAQVDGAVPGLTTAQAATADGSITGAVEVASQLPPTSAAKLTEVASDAFISGSQMGSVLVALLALGAAVWAWRALPGPAEG